MNTSELVEKPNVNTDTLDHDKLNSWISFCMKQWEIRGYQDEELLDVYQEDFEGWSKDIFGMAHAVLTRDLRNFLRDWGVYIPKTKGAGGEINKNLEKLLQLEKPGEWPREEFDKQVKAKTFFSRDMKQLYQQCYGVASQDTPAATPGVVPKA